MKRERISITSPFNFVPRYTTIPESDGELIFDQYNPMKKTGHINVEIYPQKNLFIRGINESFYKIGDKYAIPGSTIKGMLSQLIEVITFSKARVYNEKIEYEYDGKTITEPLTNGNDFAGLLLGTDSKAQGKIYFEDALCEQIKEDQFSCRILKILQQPQPQKAGYYSQIENGERVFKGTKFYWHRDDNAFDNRISIDINEFDKFLRDKSVSLKGIELLKSKEKYIFVFNFLFGDNPATASEAELQREKDLFELIKEYVFHRDPGQQEKIPTNTIANVLTQTQGIVFAGKIRFENLTPTELGILLMALQLQENCFHHIGMAKPFGMGRIKINISALINTDRQLRYKSLLDNNGDWNLSESDITNDLKHFKNVAAGNLMNQLNRSHNNAEQEREFWEMDRMKDLLDLHKEDPYNIGKSNWIAETKYTGQVKGKKWLRPVEEIRKKMEEDKLHAKKYGPGN